MSYTKDTFTAIMSAKSGLTKKDTVAAYDAFIKTAKEALMQGEDVTIVGFGSFKVVQRKARTSRHPKTGKTLMIAARKSVAFKMGKELKEGINPKE